MLFIILPMIELKKLRIKSCGIAARLLNRKEQVMKAF
nr:MAG TPA: hypothetical protein [Caudoviricetes sp.]